MAATREQDEVLLSALRLLRRGVKMRTVARHVGKDPSNLMKAVRAVMVDDMAHDDPKVVAPHYPFNQM